MSHLDTSKRTSDKIVLVYPSSTNGVQSLFTYHKDHAIGHKPPQSVLILATFLRSQGIKDVMCMDAQMEEWSPEETVEQLVKENPFIVGFTAWSDFWYPTWKTVKLLRERLPNVIIALGGPHCSVYPEETLRATEANFVVKGDGEDVLLSLVEDLYANRPIREQPGLWRKEADGTIIAPEKQLAMVDDLERIPPPDRTLLPIEKYSSVLTPAKYETTMLTSRGCPYKCVFCKMDVQKVYARSAEQVVEEFQQIADLGITDVQVYDDTFTWGHARAVDICNGIIDRGIKVNWAIRDRANRVTPELYQLLRKAGCTRSHFGVETGSPRILKDSGKFITIEQIETGIQIAKESGMTVMAYFMFGFIDETPEDARMTIEFAKKLDPNYPVFVVLIPYPGTEIYKQGIRNGLLSGDFWREFTLNPTPDYIIPELIEDHMDRKALIEMRNTGTRELYFRPKRIVRELSNLASFEELSRKARLGYLLAKDVYFNKAQSTDAPKTLHG